MRFDDKLKISWRSSLRSILVPMLVLDMYKYYPADAFWTYDYSNTYAQIHVILNIIIQTTSTVFVVTIDVVIIHRLFALKTFHNAAIVSISVSSE